MGNHLPKKVLPIVRTTSHGVKVKIPAPELKPAPAPFLAFKSFKTNTLVTNNGYEAGDGMLSAVWSIPTEAAVANIKVSPMSTGSLEPVTSVPEVQQPLQLQDSKAVDTKVSEVSMVSFKPAISVPEVQQSQQLQVSKVVNAPATSLPQQSATDAVQIVATPKTGPPKNAHNSTKAQVNFSGQNASKNSFHSKILSMSGAHVAPKDGQVLGKQGVKQGVKQVNLIKKVSDEVVGHRNAARSFVRRKYADKADIIISACDITRNLIKVFQHKLPSGNNYEDFADNWTTDKYNLEEHFIKMEPEDQKVFAAKSSVEIDVDVALGFGGYQDLMLIIENLERMGSDLTSNTKKLTICLKFKTPPLHSKKIDDGKFVAASLAERKTIQESPIYDFLSILTQYINEKFTAITFLEVKLCLNYESMYSVLHVLPFYDLKFKDWVIKYQRSTMPFPLHVIRHAVNLLDDAAEAIQYERVEEMQKKVFITGNGYVNGMRV